MIDRVLRALKRFVRDARAVAAVEFAVSAPFMIFLILGTVEFGRYLRAQERTQAIAYSLSQMLAEQPANPAAIQSGDAAVTSDYVHFLLTMAGKQFPDAAMQSAQTGDNCWWCNLTVSMGSLAFKASPSGCSGNCTYTPQVMWNWWSFPECNSTFVAVSPDTTPTTDTLPSNLYGPNSLVVVLVDYHYIPQFLPGVVADTHIVRASYTTPRYVPIVEGEKTNSSNWGVQCQGVLSGY